MKCIAAVLSLTLLSWALADAERTELRPPVARKVPHVTKIHGDTRTDNYFWLREKKQKEVVDHLKAENAYTEAMTKHLKAGQEKLYKEALSRIQQTDQDVPVRDRGYWYYTRTVKGKQYPIRCRKKGTLEAPEEVLLDGNVLAQGHKFLSLGPSQVSDDGKLLAYNSDITAFREYFLSIKDLETGKLLEDRKLKTTNFAWAPDNKTLFYVTDDHAKRPYRLYRHVLGSDKDE